jgi:crossover junction endodeoxyribonuclease RusA
MKPLSLTLPMPPSMNSLWRSNRGRVHRSEEYRSWLTQAGWQLKLQHPLAIPGWVTVRIAAAIPARPIDLDNITKGLLDLLVEHRVIEDDRKVAAINSRWDKTIATDQVQLTIKRSSPPASWIGMEKRK